MKAVVVSQPHESLALLVFQISLSGSYVVVLHWGLNLYFLDN